MNDLSKILSQAKELEMKMKESQEKIKNITVEGVSGSNSVKVILNGDGEITKIDISPETLKEEKTILEDLIMAAHNNAKIKLKSKTSEEISKAAGGLSIPGLKFPL
jgi:DNA-binding YbaB/EbfC family protein|tara:strand:+ start:1721 stop:2038 length:318 start_codon:yes stop_codon:yes gene_type:complete